MYRVDHEIAEVSFPFPSLRQADEPESEMRFSEQEEIESPPSASSSSSSILQPRLLQQLPNELPSLILDDRNDDLPMAQVDVAKPLTEAELNALQRSMTLEQLDSLQQRLKRQLGEAGETSDLDARVVNKDIAASATVPVLVDIESLLTSSAPMFPAIPSAAFLEEDEAAAVHAMRFPSSSPSSSTSVSPTQLLTVSSASPPSSTATSSPPPTSPASSNVDDDHDFDI